MKKFVQIGAGSANLDKNFEEAKNIAAEQSTRIANDFNKNEIMKLYDKIYDYSLNSAHSFQVVCDPKSLLYIYGMQLDFSKELIGGGFNFVNPNASQTCGCGSSFAV